MTVETENAASYELVLAKSLLALVSDKVAKLANSADLMNASDKHTEETPHLAQPADYPADEIEQEIADVRAIASLLTLAEEHATQLPDRTASNAAWAIYHSMDRLEQALDRLLKKQRAD